MVTAAALAACGPPPEPPTPPPAPPAITSHRALGCWEIRPDSAEGMFLKREGHLRLDTVVVSWYPGHMSFGMIPGAGIAERPGMPPSAYWEPVGETDWVRIGWGDGFVGFTVKVAIVGDSLRGWGYSSSDAGYDGPVQRIRGKREPCG